jgi:hypothetical protein
LVYFGGFGGSADGAALGMSRGPGFTWIGSGAGICFGETSVVALADGAATGSALVTGFVGCGPGFVWIGSAPQPAIARSEAETVNESFFMRSLNGGLTEDGNVPIADCASGGSDSRG